MTITGRTRSPRSHHFTRWIEGQATGIRRELGAGIRQVITGWDIASALDIPVLYPEDILGAAHPSAQALRDIGAAWSGACFEFPGRLYVVFLNPLHARTRQNVTLAEELSHIWLGHEPSRVGFLDGGRIPLRTYDPSQEKQAYAVGAATLVPARALWLLTARGATDGEIAAHFGVSLDVVRYRRNVTKSLGLD